MDKEIQDIRPDVRSEIMQFHSMKSEQRRIIRDMKKMTFGMLHKLDEMENNLK